MDVLKKIPVREQDPKERATNFKEVCLGYNQEEAQEEASRCINCKNADRKSTRLNSSHSGESRMPSSA